MSMHQQIYQQFGNCKSTADRDTESVEAKNLLNMFDSEDEFNDVLKEDDAFHQHSISGCAMKVTNSQRNMQEYQNLDLFQGSQFVCEASDGQTSNG